MAKKSDSKKETIFFQTVVLTFQDPDSGEKVTREFLGQALFDEDRLDEMLDDDVNLSQCLVQPFAIERPFKVEIEGKDERSVEIHQKIIEKYREQQLGDK